MISHFQLQIRSIAHRKSVAARRVGSSPTTHSTFTSRTRLAATPHHSVRWPNWIANVPWHQLLRAVANRRPGGRRRLRFLVQIRISPTWRWLQSPPTFHRRRPWIRSTLAGICWRLSPPICLSLINWPIWIWRIIQSPPSRRQNWICPPLWRASTWARIRSRPSPHLLFPVFNSLRNLQ